MLRSYSYFTTGTVVLATGRLVLLLLLLLRMPPLCRRCLMSTRMYITLHGVFVLKMHGGYAEARFGKLQIPHFPINIHMTKYYFFVFFFLSHFYSPASGQAVVTSVAPPSPRFLPSIFIAHRVHQSHCSSIVHRVLLTHALALSASQFVHEKKSPRICTSMLSAGLELTKLTFTKLEDNLIRHRGDRLIIYVCTRDRSTTHSLQR